jgi:hypothetical protein
MAVSIDKDTGNVTVSKRITEGSIIMAVVNPAFKMFCLDVVKGESRTSILGSYCDIVPIIEILGEVDFILRNIDDFKRPE